MKNSHIIIGSTGRDFSLLLAPCLSECYENLGLYLSKLALHSAHSEKKNRQQKSGESSKILSKINFLLTRLYPPPTLQGAGVGASTISQTAWNKFYHPLQAFFKKQLFKKLLSDSNGLHSYGRNTKPLLSTNLTQNI